MILSVTKKEIYQFYPSLQVALHSSPEYRYPRSPLDPGNRCLSSCMFVSLFNVNGLHIIVVHISYNPEILKSRDVKHIFMWYRDVNKIVQAVRKKREKITGL